MLKPITILVWAFVTGLVGCGRFDLMNFRSQTPDEIPTESLADETQTKVKTPLIGEFVNVGNLNALVLEGVGLVTGLPGTGGDPPVSPYRTRLLDDMRRRGIKNPNQILRSKSTALVIVRAYLPPLVKKGERFDVEVRVPGEGDTKSLNGGYLLETYLTEQAYLQGELREGFVHAKAGGPILTGTSTNDENADRQRGTLIRGRILSGGVSTKDRNMRLLLRNAYRSERMSYRIATRIGQRFFDYEVGGHRVPLAEAKTNKVIELNIHSRYKDNFPRYVSVIRNIALKESDVAERVRMEHLAEDLQNPVTAARASLQLEAIGKPAIETLKKGLQNPAVEVQFYSAVALAYLGDGSGIKVLARSARGEPAFRIFALAALAVIDESESFMALRELLNGDSAETRYGAFRALKSLDPHDPFVRGELMPSGFRLHVLDVEGDPMVHMTRRKMAEIVVFGTGQEFTMPLVVRAGKDIMINGRSGEEMLTISKITLDETERRVVPNDIPSVIRAVSELGASYPDIAQLLMQAENQSNLASRLEFDALPRAGRVYLRPDDEYTASYQKKSRIGRPTMAPNLFDDDDHTVNPDRERHDEEEEPLESEDVTQSDLSENPPLDQPDEDVGTASSADVTSPAKASVSLDERADTETATMKKSDSDASAAMANRPRERLYPSPLTLFKRWWN
jgi:flagellar basal body P-ring protein FlgI